MRVWKYLLLGTVACFDGEDGGGGAAPAAPAPASSPAGTVVQDRPPADAHASVPARADGEKPAAAAEVTRPEHIPEKFWDADRKAPRVEDLAKSYVELERRHMSRTAELRTTLEQEVKGSLLKDRPESPDKYEFQPPKDFLPEGLKFEPNTDDPLLKTLGQIAFDRGLSQDDMSTLVGAYLESLASQVPDPAAELKALGPKATERINATKLWAQANIPKEHFEFVGLQIARTAAGIQFIEWMKEAMGEPRQGDLSISGTSQGDGTLTAEQLTQMQADPRYFDPMKRDPAWVKKIENGWKVLELRQRAGKR